MIETKTGMRAACRLLNVPLLSFEKKIQQCYERYNTKDYPTILAKLKEDEWNLY
jgi:hypothetical protein